MPARHVVDRYRVGRHLDGAPSMSVIQHFSEPVESSGSTRVVMLGTGTPRPDPYRSGPATVIVANDTPYLIDFGAGVIRRATAAYQKGVTALGFGAVNIETAFLTHMHSDHTIGYPDLIFTPWVMGRREPLQVYGPTGIKAMTEHVLDAWKVDIEVRTNGVGQHSPDGCAVNAYEIAPGIIYKDRNVTVTAFAARHEDVANAYSFRFDAPDRTVVVSGDTTPTQELIEHSRNCDVLVHEAYSMEGYRCVSPHWQDYRRRAHTSSIELAEIANTAKPRLLVLYHRSNPGGAPASADDEDVLLGEIRQRYKGQVVAAHDLDVF
jgi:ribonuclease BN (tRNA processing enzyme)